MALEKTPIFPATTNNSKGFTLIEIMIVLTIMALLFAIGAPKIARSIGSPIKTLTRQMVMLTKQLHSEAKLKNRTYRIVIDFGDKDAGTPSQFYVESAGGTSLVATEELYDRDKQRDRDKQPPSPFHADFMKKPQQLPRGLYFSSVELDGMKDPVTEGKAYIHFFPQGLIDRAVIHLSDGKQREISLIINPLTGRTDVEYSNVPLKDVVAQ